MSNDAIVWVVRLVLLSCMTLPFAAVIILIDHAAVTVLGVGLLVAAAASWLSIMKTRDPEPEA